MELKGEFKSINEILDLMQIVALGKKDGEINLRSSEGSITLHFQHGVVVSFDSSIPLVRELRDKVINGSVPANEAVKLIIHYVSYWTNGKFAFTEKPVDVKPFAAVDTMNIMMDYTKESDETPQELQKLLRENVVFTLSSTIKDEITLDKFGWQILVELANGKPLKSVVFSSSSYSDAIRILVLLLRQGAFKVAEKAKTPAKEELPEGTVVIPQEKLEKVKELLAEAMGPMGEFLTDETLEEMEISHLTPDLVPKFVDVLISKIPESCMIEGENCRERFSKEFREILKP